MQVWICGVDGGERMALTGLILVLGMEPAMDGKWGEQIWVGDAAGRVLDGAVHE